jgi:hypothetical protein
VMGDEYGLSREALDLFTSPGSLVRVHLSPLPKRVGHIDEVVVVAGSVHPDELDSG